VVFSPEGGGVAYRAREVVVRAADAERTQQFLRRVHTRATGSFLNYETDTDSAAAVQDLQLQGIAAQPNHVLFSHSCCCGPHPAWGWGANPFQANPFQANQFRANPFEANPFRANPFRANPRQLAELLRAGGRRGHSARPAEVPSLPSYSGRIADRSKPSIVVLDTGLAGDGLRPHALRGLPADAAHVESPDEDCDGRIDPVAGHGTFIAGIIERIAPGCELSVNGVLGGYGDADEVTVADAIEALIDPVTGTGPDLVNLSFGGYALVQMERLAQAVRRLQAAGSVVVASAGNDATCRRTYPAALPGVVSVGALGPNGPAPFTNYGDWVRACAPGVDVVSTFFTSWEPPQGRHYAEWVCWSGTSFAAPAVVGALARCMREGLSGPQAVAHLLDDPALLRWPDLGTVVNSTPCWQIEAP
jgi:subtilisin family serine protease